MASPTGRTHSELLHELEQARQRVAQLEAELAAFPSSSSTQPPSSSQTADHAQGALREAVTEEAKGKEERSREWPLSLREYKRYGRQMMLSGVGLPGQLKLKRAHILVVGAGGLGCPVLLYLAAAGVGTITILDHDTVELSNLHRQVLHTEGRVGMSKAESAKIGLQALNSDIAIYAHSLAFTPSLFHSSSVPLDLLRGEYTLLLDCTDNPATRHFLNAYAVAHRIPLVSGGAVRAEGTVGAYGLPLRSPGSSAEAGEPAPEQEYGPCYACIFPPSPPPSPPPSWNSPPANEEERLERERLEDAYYEKLSLAGTGACSDEGVLGVLCGVVGIGMAAEAIKVILGTAQPSLHLFSPLSPTSPYRTIKTRSRKPTCPACGTFPPQMAPVAITNLARHLPPSFLKDMANDSTVSRWSAFLSSPSGTWPGWVDPLCEVPGVGSLSSERTDERIKVGELKELIARGKARVVDTRPEAEFGIANLQGSINIPFSRLLRDPSLALSVPSPSSSADPLTASSAAPGEVDRLTFLCRRGNDSLLASRAVKRYLAEQEGKEKKDVRVEDVVGGITAWAGEEAGFPVY
ncbi:hypothetical protein JCM8097_002438 [Rhodosporidiobolus ruineniae]